MSELDEISQAIGSLKTLSERAEKDRNLIIRSIRDLKLKVEAVGTQQLDVRVKVNEMWPFYKRAKKVFWIGMGVWITITGSVAAAGDVIASYFGWVRK